GSRWCLVPAWDFQGGRTSQPRCGIRPPPNPETTMRFYSQQHRFYAGIDLHARTLHLCVLDNTGTVVADKKLPCHFESLLQALAPFREDLVLGVECMFGWYWLADRCAEH